ncbi:hypothetical protein [uncultured Pseudokineococcus sp.]|uniref:hypothetical protein n=1 Tax=uncultured Pseudokineococcus sp. TaxID=1642928 RepID=UPI002614CCD0|nr:hypothetical protein [uncultured Pseudokineococcus sp.]
MTITTLVIEQSAVLAAASPPVLAGAGVFDRVSGLSQEALDTIKVIGVLVGAFVALGGIIRARGAVAGSVVAFLVGAFIGWAVWNIDNPTLRNEIGSDLTSAPASAPAWEQPAQAADRQEQSAAEPVAQAGPSSTFVLSLPSDRPAGPSVDAA